MLFRSVSQSRYAGLVRIRGKLLSNGEYVDDTSEIYMLKFDKDFSGKTEEEKAREESDAELFKYSLEKDGVNNDFIESSLFNDLSENVAEAEKAFSFDEFEVPENDSI